MQTLEKSLRFGADSFQPFIYFSPISQRTFNGLDKSTNGTIDNQGVKLPKNKEQELRTRTTKRKKEKVAAAVVLLSRILLWVFLCLILQCVLCGVVA